MLLLSGHQQKSEIRNPGCIYRNLGLKILKQSAGECLWILEMLLSLKHGFVIIMLHSETSTKLVQFMCTVWLERDFKMVLVWRIKQFGWRCFLSPSPVLYKEPDRAGMSEYPVLSSNNFWVLREGTGERSVQKVWETSLCTFSSLW